MVERKCKRLGFREWQWRYGKARGDKQDEIEWRRYYFKKSTKD